MAVVSLMVVSAVQFYGQKSGWPPEAVYIGMPGPAARAYGIRDEEAGPFGKPWRCMDDPRGWHRAYLDYLVDRLERDAAFAAEVKALEGKVLLCWCAAKPKQGVVACHGHLLAEFVQLLNS